MEILSALLEKGEGGGEELKTSKNVGLKFEFSMVDKNAGRFVKHHPVSLHTRVNNIFQRKLAVYSELIFASTEIRI